MKQMGSKIMKLGKLWLTGEVKFVMLIRFKLLEIKVSYVKQERLWMSIWFSHQKIQSTPYYYRGGVRCEGKRRRDSVCHYWLVVARKTRIFCAGTSRSGCTAWYMPGSACRQRGRNKCSKVVEFSNWQTNWMLNSNCPLQIWWRQELK